MSTVRDNTVKFVVKNAGKLCNITNAEFWPIITGTRLIIGYPISVSGGALDTTVLIGGDTGYFNFEAYKAVRTLTWVYTDNIKYFDFITIDRIKLVNESLKAVLPHKYNRCGAAAMIIYNTVECTNSSCVNFCTDIRV